MYVKGSKQAGEEKEAENEIGTAILDLTTRVLTLVGVSGNASYGKKGRKWDK